MPFSSLLEGYLPQRPHGDSHRPSPLFASEAMYSSLSLHFVYGLKAEIYIHYNVYNYHCQSHFLDLF